MDTSKTLTFPGRLDSLTAINELVTRAAEAAGLDARAVCAVQLAVDEACSNIIEHAYGGEGPDPIECCCRVTDQGLTVILRDYGRPFDPTSVPDPDLQASLQDRCIGGLGVYFMRQLMDKVRFDIVPGTSNTLTMEKETRRLLSDRSRTEVRSAWKELLCLSEHTVLEELLDAILVELERSLPYDVATVWLWDDDDLSAAAVHGQAADVCLGDLDSDLSSWITKAAHAHQPTIHNPRSFPDPLGDALGLPTGCSAIAAPLRVEDRRIGLLTLAHRSSRHYGAESQMILAAFASYAAVAIENTRLYQESQEQALISTVMLQVAEAARSLTSLEQVLETVVHLAAMLAGVSRCAVLLWEESGSAFRPAAAHGLSPIQRSIFDQCHIAPGDVPVFDELRLHLEPVVMHNAATDPGLSGALMSAIGFESVLLLPLLAQGRVLGALLVDYRSDLSELETPLEARLGIVQGIAYQTASAIENERLREAQQEEAYVSAALLQVAHAITSSNDLDAILSAIVRIMPILVGVEHCILFLWDQERSVFELAQAYGISGDREAALLARQYAPGDFALLDAVRERGSLVVHSYGALGEADGPIPLDLADLFRHRQGQTRSLLTIPLSVKGDVLGVMMLEEAITLGGSREKRLEIIAGIADQVAMAVQNERLQQERVKTERLEHEIQLAREIQQSLIPGELPQPSGWELAATWRAARQVTGDFYDLIDLPGGGLGLVVADVAGKGMPAALVMALTRTLVRATALQETRPAAVLARVNDLLVPDMRRGMFVTALYAVLSRDTGELAYANAGHNLPLLLRSRTRDLEQLCKGGMALGVLEGVRLEERTIWLEPGDCLVIYTDGISEAFSPEGTMYGPERLRDVILAADGSSAQAMLEAIDNSVLGFVGDASPSDDLTLIVLRRLE